MALMTTTITVREVPDSIARKLKSRAVRNHRSLQGEIMAILQSAAAADAAQTLVQPQPVYVVEPTSPQDTGGAARRPTDGSAALRGTLMRSLTLRDLWERAKAKGLSTPAEAAAMVREDRDGR